MFQLYKDCTVGYCENEMCMEILTQDLVDSKHAMNSSLQHHFIADINSLLVFANVGFKLQCA